ncbi:MAG: polysaccharide biosynthesis tyrosine autokinase [Synechococcaceae cyanobacterium RL_1_2]|nr:polysaccharide biosynthesis tyrosine autokinase [Synechococcaceae cyanobacterium RL_1_2]
MISTGLFFVSFGLAHAFFHEDTYYPGNVDFLVESGDNLEKIAVGKDYAESYSIPTLLEIFKSEPILQSMVNKLSAFYPDITIEQLQHNLAIKQVSVSKKDIKLDRKKNHWTNIINVSYKSEDPQKVDAVLRAVEDTYLQYDLEKTQITLSKALDFLETQIKESAAEVKKSANKLSLLQKNYVFLGDINHHGDSLSDRKLALEKRLKALELELSRQRERSQLLESKLNSTLNNSNANEIVTNQNFVLRNGANQPIHTHDLLQMEAGENLLDQKIQLIDSQYKQELQSNEVRDPLGNSQQKRAPNSLAFDNQPFINGGSSAPFIYSDFKSNAIKQQLDAEINISAQYAKIASIEAEIEAVKHDIKRIPLIQEKHRELSSEFERAEQEYQSLLRLKQQIELEKAQVQPRIVTLNEVQVAKEQVNDFWPAFIFSGLISAGLALFAYRYLSNLDTTIRQLEQIDLIAEQSLLGVIPKVISSFTSSDVGRIKKFDHESNLKMLRAIRSLALSISKSKGHANSYCLAITSSFPNEGKSTLIYNVANSLAQLGYKTVLIDADLRKPTLHRLSGLVNGLGLTDALTYGYHGNLNELLYKTSTPNLSIMTSGTLPPNPLPLLNSRNMGSLVKQLQQQYEYVLFDCPPMVVKSDVKTIANYCDGSLVVCRLGLSTHNSLQDSLATMSSETKSTCLGVVANYYDAEHTDYSTNYHQELYNSRPQKNNRHLTDQLSFLNKTKGAKSK